MGYSNLFLSPHLSTHILHEGPIPCNSEILSSLPLSPTENGKVSRIVPLQPTTAILYVRKNGCLTGSACSILFPPTHMPRFCRLRWGNHGGIFKMFPFCLQRWRSLRRAPNFPLQIKHLYRLPYWKETVLWRQKRNTNNRWVVFLQGCVCAGESSGQ